MSEDYYINRLYPLQDEVLTTVGKIDTSFYLTGGTNLSRFLLNHRYSDDLDFFVNGSPKFTQEVEQVVSRLNDNGKVSWGLKDESFCRVFVERDNVKLKLEFVNDVKYRVGLPARSHSGFLLDTWENILSNKITALSRSAAKDFIDVLFLSLTFSFNWEEMINHAKQKDAWIAEHEIANFFIKLDMERLQEVAFPSSFNFKSIKFNYFETLARDAFNGSDNSLVGAKFI
jgi:predicted nucleotidyltransferase component of viral defense system